MNEKGRQTKLLAAVAILAMVVCVFAIIMPSDSVSAEFSGQTTDDGKAIITSLDELGEAQSDSGITGMVLGINIVADNANISITKDLDLDGYTIDVGAYIFLVGNNATVSNGTITGNGNHVVGITTASLVDVDVVMEKGSNGPYAGIVIYDGHSGTIKGGSVTYQDVEGTYGAIQIAVNATNSTIGGVTINGEGLITYMGGNLELNGMGEVTMQFTGNMTITSDSFKMDANTTIAETVLGWDANNSAKTASSTDSIALDIQANINLGDVRQGDDKNTLITPSVAVNDGTTIMNGGVKNLTVTVATDSVMNATNLVAKSAVVNGTLIAAGDTDGIESITKSPSATVEDENGNPLGNVTTETSETDLTKAFENNDVVTFTGTVSSENPIIIPELKSGQKLEFKNAISDATFTIKIGSNVAIKFTNFSAVDLCITSGSLRITATTLAGTIESVGEVVDLDGGLSGDLTLNKSNEAGALNQFVIQSRDALDLNGKTLTITSGTTLTANGAIEGTGTIDVQAGATLIYSQISDGITIKTVEGSIVKILGGQGTENIISTDMTVTGDVYLSQETTILEGVTVTVTRNSTLHLMSFDLINNGTIVVDRGGKIVSDNGGAISLMATGSIDNNGTIGGDKSVTISNGASPALNQSVSIQGIDGISFAMVRTGTGDDRVYNMYVSGDVGRVSSATVYNLTLNNVGINADMTIGSNITLEIEGTVTVMNNVTFTFNGAYMSVSDGGAFYLQNGASAVINSPMNGEISVETGEVDSGNTLVKDENYKVATVDFGGSKEDSVIKGVTGITVSVGRINVYDETNDETDVFQQMYLNGTATVSTTEKNVKDPEATLTIDGTAYVIDTLTISKGVTVSGFFDVDAAGTVIVKDGATYTELTYSGARYVIETTESETVYYTSFADAMASIATAQDNIIYLSGTYEISGTYVLAAGQAIEAEDNYQITVGKTGDITVEIDADIQDTAFSKIEGKVLVKEGVGYTPSATAGIYAVKAVDAETNDTTYSGFGVAMDNAAAGQTITVVGTATYDGNLVIPDQVTVDVQQDITLNVLGNVTVEKGGKLILDNGAVMTVGKTAGRDYTVTVNGTLDASEGGKVNALTGADVDFYSAGTSTFPVNGDNFGVGVTVNAAYYIDADQVYTTLAAAVAYAETNALPTVYAVGTFSETGAIESDDVDIVIGLNSSVTLGDITLNAAKISVSKPADGNTTDKAGQYTASVSGLSGAGDAAVTSTVSVSKTDATIESKVTLNAEGINQYVLTISGLKGATTIAAGTVQFADDAALSISRDDSLTIATGATLLVAKDKNLSISIVKANPSNAGYFVNNGAIQIDGTLTLPAASATVDDAVLPGTVNVSETGAIDAAGNVIVTGDVTVAADGAFTVAGVLSVGETPDYLGEAASGSVSGAITLDGVGSNYVVVYAGATVADAVIGNASSTEPKTTMFQVNGLDLMTVYTFGNETILNFEGTVRGLDNLVGYDEYDDGIDLVWKAEGNTIPSRTAIGDYAIVSTELAYRSALITISVGTHITVTIDGVIVDNSIGYPVKIGTHTVSATVDPGYSGEVTITFNGQTVSNGGTIEITSEMLSSLDPIVLSVTGSLTQDSTVIVEGGSSDSGMGLTDYLLIILVVLIAVMAIIVAMRLMRS